ncbi:uncharacterized protein ALTATR162_LOCUS6171 [Alternaria atra]|uniref:Uncharacterized protein n=1 Tax=Alternaria atra TaxID=119953 RepID=A0A8J2IBA6_9PLEO|nr:uncharacterized protein ALTATR162_LOCUS6171 [Alternaria atra]CAG5162165.1 unnamed protein product [Alternaria atra]
MASVHQTAQRAWMLPLAASNTTRPLAVAVATYPIQEALISFLTPDDLVTLTLISQTLHGHIRMDNANSKANLLSKTLCPVLGVCVRTVTHCPCPAKTFDAIIGCARFGFSTESRPCVECGVNTCDECRIHALYNPLTEDCGFDQRRWWAGFYFLEPTVVAVYPPKDSECSVWNLPIEDMKPLHDQGRFHIPLNVNAIGDPEPIQRIVDLDLGTHRSINPVGRTQYPYSGHQIVSFLNMITNKRKDLTCLSCYQERRKERLACYIKEDTAGEDLRCHIPVADEVGEGHSHVCHCGAEFTPEVAAKVMCNWCKGEIEGPQQGDENNVIGGNSEGIDEDEEQEEEFHEEDHSAADFANLPQDEFGFAENHDESLSVYVNGECIRGERLGRSIVRQWMMTIQGKLAECVCCVCNSRNSHHTHAGDGEEDRNDEEDDDSSDDQDLPDLEEVGSAAGFEDQWGLD